jgi:hypothetical protein
LKLAIGNDKSGEMSESDDFEIFSETEIIDAPWRLNATRVT